jgi:imidazolonepropionase
LQDLALINAGELVTCGGFGEAAEEKLGIIEDGALLVKGGRVEWVGKTTDLKRKSIGKPGRTIDAKGGLVTPGFVDPHTHIIFAGSREDELERKIRGESYTRILASGGGIVRTIRETRQASMSRILEEAGKRLAQLLSNGVTTTELKTGYGQRLEDELKLLKVIRRLQETSRIELIPTFLGLHATPPEFGNSREYAEYTTREMLPAVAESNVRPAFTDCFCEEGVFSREECFRYLRASKKLGLRCKIHADEFADSGGASLAAEVGCVSADHLGKSDSQGIHAMSRKGVLAVLLPGTSFCSHIPYADARGIVEAGCEVALGTDLSPNSWIESPQLVMALACNGMRMSPAETLLGFTRNAAMAVSREDLGVLKVGTAADFVIHSVRGYRFLSYRLGGQYVEKVFKSGAEVFSARRS